MNAAPAYATPRSSSPTDGAAVALVADVMGTPLMPWQRQVAEVALERKPDHSWRYPVVVVTVPRQSGKTVLMGSVMVHRALTRPASSIFYTAQTGKDAAERWDDVRKKCEQSALLRDNLHIRKGAGRQAIEFPNGSTVRPFAPTENSLHGYTPPLVMVDEAMAFDAADGSALMGAIAPAQITIPDRQLWIVSTAGSARSTWLREWIELGRSTIGDPNAPLAYFEWSMPEGLDPYAPATWARFHPALGHTITTEALASQIGVPPGEWLRAYCNVWTKTQSTVVPLDQWDDLAQTIASPGQTDRVAFGIDATPTLDQAAIVAAWTIGDQIAVKPVMIAEGIGWLPAAIATLDGAYPRASWVTDSRGPTLDLLDTITRPLIEKITTQEAVAGFSAFIKAINSHALVHDASPTLRDQLAAAASKALGDGWMWSRKQSAGPIPAVTAATMAVREVLRPAPAPVQVF